MAGVRRYDSGRLKRLLAFLLLAAAALLPTSTCRSTKHTVARIITPAAVPTEVFVPAPAAPAAPAPAATFTPRPVAIPPAAPATAAVRAAPPRPSPTPTAASMRVVTAPAADRSPGVLYEQYVPTVVATTPVVTPIATRAVSPRSTRPPRTPTPAATQKPGVYYEDEEGRPLTPTPQL